MHHGLFVCYNIEQTPEKALDEVVADSCEMMLRDSNAVQQLIQEDMTLAQKIKSWIDKFVANIKKAFERVEPNSLEASLLSESKETFEEIQKLWDDAFVDAVHNSQVLSDNIGTNKNINIDNDNATKYSNKSTYNEFATLTMRLANSVSTQKGDTKIFSRQGKFYLMEADGDGGCVEIANGTYKKVRRLYEQSIKEIRGSREIVSKSVNSAKSNIRGMLSDNVNGKLGNDVRNIRKIGKNGSRNNNTSAGNESDIRSNKGNEKVSFSLRDNVEETDKLVAVHNLTSEKLMKSLELGGLPMPSIAIAKANQGHGGFGDISFVFDKDTIDPKRSSNKVFSGDAYTPTFMSVVVIIFDIYCPYKN